MYSSINFPFASLPFMKWQQLWTKLADLGTVGWALNVGVLVVLTLLLLWARRQDRRSEYMAYMPTWYRRVRMVEQTARNSKNCLYRVLAWPLLLVLWFATNHPWIVIFLVKPGEQFKHAHLVMILYNMILAE